MNFVFFVHSLTSCWNHGNAHFLRGVLRVLNRAGHRTVAFEPPDGWSRTNLVSDHGDAPLREFRKAFGDLAVCEYGPGTDLAAAVDRADAVIVHEWTDPDVIAALGRMRRRGAGFSLLFHDTHHRAVSDPTTARALPIDDYDAVLAFGDSLAEVYRRWGWGNRALVWHEAADATVFRPPMRERKRGGVVWIGNWGDDERTDELDTFLFEPVSRQGLPLTVHGVRYPEAAIRRLTAAGVDYRGWLANHRVPDEFARYLCTVHVPRRFYAEQLPGIPTIRMFEAMACGIPLICAPWNDREGLFRAGYDYLSASGGDDVAAHLRLLQNDPAAWSELRDNGIAHIRARHTCTHRAEELIGFLAMLGKPATQRISA